MAHTSQYHGEEAFALGLIASDSFNHQLLMLQDNLHHPSLPSLSTSLRNSWQLLTCTDSDTNLALQWSRVATEFIWEQLNTGDWKDVAVEWRQAYSLATLLTAMALVRKGRVQEALQEVDRGLLMGAPVLENALQSLASVLTAEVQKSSVCGARNLTQGREERELSCTKSTEEGLVSRSNVKRKVVFKNYGQFKHSGYTELLVTETTITGPNDQPVPKRPRTDATEDLAEDSWSRPCSSCPVESVSSPPLSEHPHRVPVVHCPSLETFLQQYMLTSTPVVVAGVMELWPAYAERKWSLDYLKKVAGPRTVPVELGSRYTDEEWTQRLMTIAEFIDEYILSQSDSSTKGYLAQHQLFDQIPELHDDILTPDYCYMHTAEDLAASTEEGEGVKVNAWFGPKGTVSPLHYDPEHNLLAQVMGRKYIRLYSKEQTPYLYPHEGLLTNTSKVDVERPDLEQFPLFSKAVPMDCTLRPGQMLYIPPNCWHYVCSLDISFSVSFWWS